jgi:hypothetical protein
MQMRRRRRKRSVTHGAFGSDELCLPVLQVGLVLEVNERDGICAALRERTFSHTLDAREPSLERANEMRAHLQPSGRLPGLDRS